MLKLKYNLFIIVSALLLLFTATPFFLLGNSAFFFASTTALYLGTFFIYINQNPIRINNYKKNVALISIILFIYLAFPFREYDSFLFVNVWILIFITFLFIKDEDLIKIIHCFFDFLFYICLGAIIILFLKVIGVELPRWEYFPEGTDVKKSVYYIYPLTTELIFQNYEIFGRSLFRVSGIFSEPGHFGVICASFLYINPVLFSKRKRTIVLIAGLLSLSMAFYVLLATSYLIRSKLTTKHILYFTITITLVYLLYAFLPEEFIFRFFGNKISSDNDVLDARVSMEFSAFYSNIEYTKNWIFGAGSIVMSEFNITSSDYRAFISKYGIFGILLLFSWFYKLNIYELKSKEFYFAASFFVIVLAHRSWLVSYLVFYFVIYAIIFSYKNYKI